MLCACCYSAGGEEKWGEKEGGKGEGGVEEGVDAVVTLQAPA